MTVSEECVLFGMDANFTASQPPSPTKKKPQSYEEEQFQLIGQPQIRKQHRVCSSNEPEYDEFVFLVSAGEGRAEAHTPW